MVRDDDVGGHAPGIGDHHLVPVIEKGDPAKVAPADDEIRSRGLPQEARAAQRELL